jgi:cytochrome P450
MVEQMRLHIQEIANDLLSKVEKKGFMDVVHDFAFPLPVTVIAEMLGVPACDHAKFKVWSNAVTKILEPGANAVALINAAISRKRLISYLRPLIAERRRKPQEDLISSLVQAEEAGNHLTEEELLSTLILLLVAGHETTVNLISNSILALMTHPDQMQLLQSKPELLNNAIEEFLRWSSPVQIVRRVALENIEIGGRAISTGQTVIVSLGAANRDPERFPDPDRLDITRSDTKNLSFGFGIHHCLGSSLATAEGQLAVATLIKRMPGIKLAIDHDRIEWKRPFSLRGPKELPVSF